MFIPKGGHLFPFITACQLLGSPATVPGPPPGKKEAIAVIPISGDGQSNAFETTNQITQGLRAPQTVLKKITPFQQQLVLRSL
jgi:hypothetical protein